MNKLYIATMSDKEIKKTDREWREALTDEEYEVMRQKGTEAPFSGKYWNSKERGMYRCHGCGAMLFDSNAKLDSSTGWPSFTESFLGALEYREDRSRGMSRTEVMCSACGAHLGHVFDDGPKAKGGKRYCINSVCLELEVKEKPPKEA